MLGRKESPPADPVPAETAARQSAFVSAVARLSDPTPLTSDELLEIATLQEGPGLSQHERLALVGLREDRKWRDVAAAEKEKPATPAVHRSQAEFFEELAEQRRQLWRSENNTVRGLYLLSTKLGTTSNAALVREIADALAADPAKSLEAEPPIFYRSEMLPDHVRRQNGLW